MILPVSRSRQTTLKVWLRSAPTASGWTNSDPSAILWLTPGLRPGMAAPSSAVVKKIFFSQTMGDEWPRPAMGVFQLMFFLPLHSSGNPVSVETPCPSGPRHWGQLESFDLADAEPAKEMVRSKQKENVTEIRRKSFMLGPFRE